MMVTVLACPHLFLCELLSLQVKMQGQRPIKTAIKNYRSLDGFRIEGQKLGTLLENNYIKNQSYQSI